MNTQISWLSSYQEFQQIKNQWNQLAESYSSHFFLRHEWFDSAWGWADLQGKIKILTLSQAGQLIAILPLLITQQKYKTLQFNQLEFLSIPDTQICDIIIHPDHLELGKDCIAAVWQLSNWDKLKLHYLPTNSTIEQIFKAYTQKTHKLESHINHPIVDINTNWDEYYATKSRRLKKGNNLARNHLKKAGNFEMVNLNTLSTPDLLNIIKQVSEKSWKKKTQTTFDNKGPYLFLQKLTELTQSNRWLNVWGLKLNDQVIALEYQIDYKGNIYALRSDYISEMDYLSPGTYLNWQVLLKMFEQQKQKYYMGPGQNKYKLRWQNISEPVYTVSSYRSNMTGLLLNTFENIVVPKVKPLKEHINSLFVKEKVD